MKKILRFLLIASMLGVNVDNAVANGEAALKIVVNLNVRASAVSRDDVKRIFLVVKTSLSDGYHVEPVLEKEATTYQAFVKQYIGKTGSALTVYYRSLVFTGKASMPKSLDSDAEMVAYVAQNKDAIGFVGPNADTSGVKTLDVK